MGQNAPRGQDRGKAVERKFPSIDKLVKNKKE